MRPPEPAERAVAVAIHDVAPATLSECRELMAMLDDVAATPITLLVVPQFHYGVDAAREARFVDAMNARLARGDELVLHGQFHLDDAPPPARLGAWIERRVLTRSEGEFAALDERAAAWRLARGVALFRACGWPLAGFVPPAWLMSDGTRRALAASSHPFEYATVRTGIYHLPGWRFERTANLWYSPDTALRRGVSRLAIAHELAKARSSALLRISLHPQDVRGVGVLAHWARLIGDALATRRAVTKVQWVRGVRPAGERPWQPLPGALARAGAAPAREAS